MIDGWYERDVAQRIVEESRKRWQESAPDARRGGPRRGGGVRAPRRVVRRRAGRVGQRPRPGPAGVRALGGQAAAGARQRARRRARALRAVRPPPGAGVRLARRLGGAHRVVAEVLEACGLVEGALGCGPDCRSTRARWPARGRRGSSTTARASTRSGSRAASPRAGRSTATSAPATRCSARCAIASSRPAASTRRRPRRPTAAACARSRCRCGAGARVRELAGGRLGPSGDRCAAAMRAHALLVAYDGAIDTELMRAEDGLVAKIGAEGVLAVGLADGSGLALKVRDGSVRAVAPAGAALTRSALGLRAELPDGSRSRRSSTRAGSVSASCARSTPERAARAREHGSSGRAGRRGVWGIGGCHPACVIVPGAAALTRRWGGGIIAGAAAALYLDSEVKRVAAPPGPAERVRERRRVSAPDAGGTARRRRRGPRPSNPPPHSPAAADADAGDHHGSGISRARARARP